MKFTETKIKGCYVIEPKVFGDSRGYFFESFSQKQFIKEVGYSVDFVQDNQSFSSYGVLRGLHFQTGEDAQAKLVRVLKGTVLDVAVDLRKGSETFGEHISIELSEENKRQFFVPKGFAHGFVVLSETAEFFYKVDNYYAPQSEGGIFFNDPEINIDWGIDLKDVKLAPKDEKLPTLKEFIQNQSTRL